MNVGSWIATLLALAFVPSGLSALLAKSVVNWEEIFRPARIGSAHVKAQYVDAAGVAHTIELWRQGTLQLRRDTDSALALYLRKDESGQTIFHAFDWRRRIHFGGNQAHLYEAGVFSDYMGLATFMTSASKFSMTAVVEGRVEHMSFGDCQWYSLQPRGRMDAQHVCWSPRWAIPFAIRRAADGVTVFSILSLSDDVPPEAFTIPTTGFSIGDEVGEEED